MKHAAWFLKESIGRLRRWDDIYKVLRKHLDTMPVGMPATLSGVERRILKAMFSIDEARLAVYMDWHFETADTIFKKAGGDLSLSRDAVITMLNAMEKKGAIYAKKVDGTWRYALHPLLIGMYEMQLPVLNSSYYLDIREYTTKILGIEYLTTAIPQTRVIPVERSVTPEHTISTYDEIRHIVETTAQDICLAECICRKAHAMLGEPCKMTDIKESCLAFGDFGAQYIRNGWGRSITKKETMDLLERLEKVGLVLQPSNEKAPEFICICCGCCCGVLEMINGMPRPADFVATNFYATLDTVSCTGCGKCLKRCQMNALVIEDNKAVLDDGKCIGCGLCIPTCKEGALKLVKKEVDTVPPESFEEKYKVIMAGKKSTVGKFWTAGKGALGVKP